MISYLKSALTGKYGKPKENVYWSNKLFKKDPQNWGTAVSVGHLKKFCEWSTPRTAIIVGIYGDNHEINVGIEYTSKELEGWAKKIEKQKQLKNL